MYGLIRKNGYLRLIGETKNKKNKKLTHGGPYDIMVTERLERDTFCIIITEYIF